MRCLVALYSNASAALALVFEKFLRLDAAGTEKGITLGTTIGMFVRNKDMRPHDYGEMSQVPRRWLSR